MAARDRNAPHMGGIPIKKEPTAPKTGTTGSGHQVTFTSKSPSESCQFRETSLKDLTTYTDINHEEIQLYKQGLARSYGCPVEDIVATMGPATPIDPEKQKCYMETKLIPKKKTNMSY
jgi:hypothetical protein